MIKFSPRKTSAEQSLKVFSNISYIFYSSSSDSNVNNNVSKKLCNDIYKSDCRSHYAWKDIGGIWRFLQEAALFCIKVYAILYSNIG